MNSLDFSHVYQILTQQAVFWLPQLLSGLVIFLAFWVGAILLSKLTVRLAAHLPTSKQLVVRLGAKAIKGALLLLGGITALGSMGVNVSALVASVGLSGFALSFALKDILSNMLAGVLILLYCPFEIGQHVTISGEDGVVLAVDLRYVTIETKNGIVLIPNGNVLKNSVLLRSA